MFGNRFTFITVFLLAVLLFTGCNNNISNSGNQEATPSPSAHVSSPDIIVNARTPERMDGTLTLTLGFSTDASDPRAVASEQFKSEVEKKSNGTVKIVIYPEGQRGSDSELIKGVISGTTDMTISSAGNFTGYSKNVGVSALPFLFNSFEESWRFLDSSIAHEIDKELLEYNIRVLAYFDNGFRCVTTNTIPVNTPDDMKGLYIRTSDNAVVRETMSTLGANPETLAFTELYNALAAGTFDAQENPIPIIYNSKLYEVQSYLTITNHSCDAMPFVISDAAWKQLTEEEQQIIQNAATAAQTMNRDMVKEQTEIYVEKLQTEGGMTIIYPDLTAFKEMTKDVAVYFSYDKDLLDSIEQVIHTD